MRYCPKYDTWIHKDECEETEDCWNSQNWDACYKLKAQVTKAEREANNLCKMCKFHPADYKDGFCSPLCETIWNDTTPAYRAEKWPEIHG